jgi:hypothetical protein
MTLTSVSLPFRVLLLSLALSLGAATGVHAQEDAPTDSAASEAEDPAESRATSFRAVSGSEGEDVPGGLLLVGAYGAIAVLLLLFLLRQRSQLQTLAGRISSLRGEIERKGAEQNKR